AGMAGAYHAPLAGSLFIAEILFGTLMLASLGPVVVSAVVALLTTHLLNGSDSLLYTVHLTVDLHAREYVMIVSTGLVAGLCGPLLMWLMTASHNSFLRLKLSPPWQLALGGLIVGLLSLLTPTVWGNGYSVVQSFLLSPPLFSLIGGIFACKISKILAVLASMRAKSWRCSPAAGLARRAASLRQHYLSDYPLECFWVGYGDSGCQARMK
ncbi:Chloride channel protein, partial [Salmonella enterica subsp. enterica serovar Mississippi str. A4-633]